MDLQTNFENVNTWGVVQTANLNKIDDLFVLLDDALVTTTGSANWANLKGTKASLEERLDVGINDNGTLDADAIDGDVSRSRKSELLVTTTLDERLHAGEQRAAQSPDVDTPSSVFVNPTARMPNSRSSTLSIREQTVGSDESWFLYHSDITTMVAISHSGSTSTVDLTSAGNDVDVCAGGRMYSLTRPKADLTQDFTTGNSGSNTFYFGFTGLDVTDAAAVLSAVPYYLMDFQLTRTSTDYVNGTGSLGGSVFSAANIGSASGTGSGSNLNDWQPVAGEFLVIGAKAYKIASVTSAAITIQGVFVEDYSAGVAWTIKDYTQPNGLLVFGSSSSTFFPQREGIAIYPPSVMVPVYNCQMDKATGVVSIEQWEYSTQLKGTYGSVYPKTYRAVSGTPLAPAPAPERYTFGLAGTLGEAPRIRGISVWVIDSSGDMHIDPVVATNDSDGDKSYCPAFTYYAYASHGALDIYVGKIPDYNESGGTAFRSPQGATWASGYTGTVNFTAISSWGIFIDYI
jgi:hypothetical protein